MDNGVFGSNSNEAKELILFISNHINNKKNKDNDKYQGDVFYPENVIRSICVDTKLTNAHI